MASAAAVVKQNVLSDKKDAFRVEFDSLPRILASQGSFIFKDTDEDLGAQVQIQLMSYQDSWTCGPNDTKADAELVKYADNPTTAQDGTDLKEHLDDLKAQGYSKASIAHRCVIVGELVSSQGKVKYKMLDKGPAQEKLAKYLGLYEKDNKQRADPMAELAKALLGSVVGPGGLNLPEPAPE